MIFTKIFAEFSEHDFHKILTNAFYAVGRSKMTPYLSTMSTANLTCEFAEVGKAQLEAQSATFATSAILEVALRFNFLF